MKDFKTIEDKIMYLHNKYPQLRDKSITETIIAYTLEFIEEDIEKVSIFAKILKELPSTSSLVRALAKMRSDNPELDKRDDKETLLKQRNFKKLLRYNSI